MLKLVRLTQCFGDYREITKYRYLLEDGKVGDIVSDGKTYIGKVVEVIPMNNLYHYKQTNKISLKLKDFKDLLFKIRSLKYKEEQEKAKENFFVEYNKILDKGYYIDPNYGFMEVSPYDSEEYEYEIKPLSERAFNDYLEFIIECFNIELKE